MHRFERENKPYFTRLQEKFEGKAQSLTPYTLDDFRSENNLDVTRAIDVSRLADPARLFDPCMAAGGVGVVNGPLWSSLGHVGNVFSLSTCPDLSIGTRLEPSGF
jgi:hypothetical protein